MKITKLERKNQITENNCYVGILQKIEPFTREDGSKGVYTGYMIDDTYCKGTWTLDAMQDFCRHLQGKGLLSKDFENKEFDEQLKELQGVELVLFEKKIQAKTASTTATIFAATKTEMKL